MANMMNMLKQATSMKKNMKKMQKELAKHSVEYSFGGITVRAKGDMTIADISIDTDQVDVTSVKSLESKLATACNRALSQARKEAGREMAKLTGGMDGLSDLLGG